MACTAIYLEKIEGSVGGGGGDYIKQKGIYFSSSECEPYQGVREGTMDRIFNF